MAHNRVLSKMYKVVVEAFADYRRRSFTVQEHADNAIEPHRKINAALKERNISEAQRCMREHLDKVYWICRFADTPIAQILLTLCSTKEYHYKKLTLIVVSLLITAGFALNVTAQEINLKAYVPPIRQQSRPKPWCSSQKM